MGRSLFASDLDGTLLGGDGALTAETIDSLRAVRATGATVIAVTGRAPRTALPILSGHDVIDVALCNNGAITLDVTTGDVVAAHYLDTAAIAQLWDEAADWSSEFGVAWEHDGQLVWNEAFEIVSPYVATTGTAVMSGFPPPDGFRTTKLMVGLAGVTAHDLSAQIDARLTTPFEQSTSGAPFIEFTAPGVNKGSMLAAWCTERGYGADSVVAYGDNQNDVSMLRWAGTGVAVANAHPLAVDAADERIGHHRDHAVALDMLDRSRRGQTPS